MQAPRYWRMTNTLYRLQGERDDNTEAVSIIQRDRIELEARTTIEAENNVPVLVTALHAEVA